jgi:hypothetical protein
MHFPASRAPKRAGAAFENGGPHQKKKRCLERDDSVTIINPNQSFLDKLYGEHINGIMYCMDWLEMLIMVGRK